MVYDSRVQIKENVDLERDKEANREDYEEEDASFKRCVQSVVEKRFLDNLVACLIGSLKTWHICVTSLQELLESKQRDLFKSAVRILIPVFLSFP